MISSEEEMAIGKIQRPKKMGNTSRRIINSDDSDDAGVVFTEGTVASTEGRSPRTRSQKQKKKNIKSPTIVNLDMETRKALLDRDLVSKSSTELNSLCREVLDDIEMVRAKSSNLKGDLSGRIKFGVSRIRDLVEVLSIRTEELEDVSRFRELNLDLANRLNESKADNARLRTEMKTLNTRIDSMQNTIDGLNEMVKSSKGYGNRIE